MKSIFDFGFCIWNSGTVGLRLLLAALLLLSLPGCGTAGKRGTPESRPAPAGAVPINELNLLSMPVAVDLDGIPGPDGFGVQVYAGSRAYAKAVPIQAGTLEFRMYDGLHWRDLEPRQTWTFTAEQLKEFEVVTSIGAGYRLALPWGTARPASPRVTLIATYSAPGQPVIHSAPNAISVSGK